MTARKALTNCDPGEVGRQWVLKCLASENPNNHWLGPLLLPELDLRKGRVLVLGCHGELPRGDAERYRASVESLNVLDSDDSAHALLQLLTSLESKAGALVVIAEDYLRHPDRDYGKTLIGEGRAVNASGTVYRMRRVAELKTPKDLYEILNQGSEYPLNAFIMSVAIAGNFVDLVEREKAEELASGLLGTIHAVYDAEGYLAWIR
jgi:hypothetical protein